MIKLVGIHKIYQDLNNGFLALKDVNIDFKDDHFVCILGKSGSGKTTLLNIIGGLDKPSSGHMVIDRELTTKFTEVQWDYFRNYKIGFVFQNYSLIEHLTVLDNVKLAIKIQGVKEEEAKNRSLDMLKKVGILDQADKLPKNLSGGQRQRVAIARALINNPQIILADEPTGNLDKNTSEQIMKLLKDISKKHLVIMVTHSKKLAKKYADRIIELKDGMVSGDTKPYVNEKVQISQPKIKNTRFRFSDKIKHAVKNICMKKWRSFLVSLGLAIGVASFILLNGISNGIKENIQENITNTLYPDLQLSIYNADMDLNEIDNFVNKLKRDEDILSVRYINSFYDHITITKIKDFELNLTSQVTYKFTDDDTNYLIGEPYKDGKWPENDNEIMLSYNLANEIYDYNDIDLLWNKLKNVTISIVSEYYFEIPEEIYYDEEISTKYIYIDEETAPIDYDEERFGPYKEQIAKQRDLYGKLALKDGYLYVCENYEQLYYYESNRIKRIDNFKIVGINKFQQFDESIVTKNYYYNLNYDYEYGEMFEVYLTDKGKENLLTVKQRLSEEAYVYDVYKEENSSVFINIFIGIAQFIISMILVVSVVTAGLMLLMVLLISIIERSREIGILRSLGATKSDVLSVFVSESAVIGFFAGILGVIISILAMIGGNIFIRYKYGDILLNVFYKSDINLIRITPLSCIISCIVCIIFAMIFGLIPSIKASKKTPINALKRL